MTPTEPAERTSENLDAVARRFLRSEFASQIYSDWPIDRRIEAYLRHYEASAFLTDGYSYNLLLERVMANIGPAVRDGVLPAPGSSDLP
ncbi:hypothetical protein [Mycolicibacterium tusciae]|nr:hypothetical protein [Mycolicibacterium tusciae]